MTSLTEFFSRQEDDNLKGISHKNNLFKRNIIAHMAVNGECTLSELTKELHISVPTITKLVQELVQENIVSDLGKVETYLEYAAKVNRLWINLFLFFPLHNKLVHNGINHLSRHCRLINSIKNLDIDQFCSHHLSDVKERNRNSCTTGNN